MDELQQYFQDEYVEDKKRIKRIDELLMIVVNSIKELTTEYGVPYEIKENTLISQSSFSASTNAMILFVLLKITGDIDDNSPLIVKIKWNCKSILEKKEEIYEGIIKKILKLLYNTIELNKSRQNAITESGSFGDNDPFTLSWLIEISKSPKGHAEGASINDTIKTACIDKVIEAFKDPNDYLLHFPSETKKSDDEKGIEEPGKTSKPKNQPTRHIFPLIRTIHIFKALAESETDRVKKMNEFEVKVKSVIQNLYNRVNQQLSYSMTSSSLFDTSELVMSLEGILLLEDDSQGINNDMVKKIFEVIKKHQENNLYWRPLKPFVITPQGLILLPLSIEIANSLLRICKHLQARSKFYFFNYFEMFRKYFDWLDSELVSIKIPDSETKNFMGWHSEHVSESNVIHPWETAQVMIFLMNYKSLLEDNLAYKSLLKARLSEKTLKKDDKKLADFLYGEPLVGVPEKDYQVYDEIDREYIKPQKSLSLSSKIVKGAKDLSYSMLLYGPPGTGKSTVAEEIARALNWKLITITPSDFLQSGGSDIEYNAKNIFKVLEEQKECVILLDEIDQLLLDRESKKYENQNDVFKFMTPSMLVKIKDLRTKARSIFIIATNYEENIDQAIKRTGRIDKKYLISLPDKEQRIRILKKLANDEKNELTAPQLEKLASQTVFYSFGELKQLLDAKDIKSPEDLKEFNLNFNTASIPKPTVSLLSYKRRFNSDNSSQFPTEEFFMLVYLRDEVREDIEFNQDETNSILEIATALNLIWPKSPDNRTDAEKKEKRRVELEVNNKKELKQKLNIKSPRVVEQICSLLDEIVKQNNEKISQS